jgi:hypothetical protein
MGALIAILAILGATSPAVAETDTSSAARWKDAWPRVSPTEYGVTTALLLAAGAATLLVPHPPSGWKGSTPLDDAVTDFVRHRDPETRKLLDDTSDVLANAAMIAPVVDAGVSAIVLADTDVLLQMLSIDLEGAILAGTLLTLSKRLVSRVRPDIEPCDDGEFQCRSDASRRSFFSGHTTASITAAALTCAHHTALEIYGGILDDVTCATMMGLALSASLLRIVSDQHYATDVLGGMAVGLFSGLVVPYLFHYRVGDQPRVGPRGKLDLVLGGAVVAAGESPRLAGAGSLGLELQLGPEWLYAVTAIEGRLLRQLADLEVQEVLPYLAVGHQAWSFGLIGDFRRERIHQNDPLNRFSAGPAISLASGPVAMRLGWTPFFEGSPDLGIARLEFTPLEWLILRLEGQRTSLTEGGVPRTVSTLLFGAGGRLAW